MAGECECRIRIQWSYFINFSTQNLLNCMVKCETCPSKNKINGLWIWFFLNHLKKLSWSYPFSSAPTHTSFFWHSIWNFKEPVFDYIYKLSLESSLTTCIHVHQNCDSFAITITWHSINSFVSPLGGSTLSFLGVTKKTDSSALNTYKKWFT